MRKTIRASMAVLPLCLALQVRAATGDYQREKDGVALQTPEGTLLVQVVSLNVVRVAYARSAILFSRNASVVTPNPAPARWTLTETSGELTLSTSRLKARVERKTGRVTFLDAAGRAILAESESGRLVENAEVQGEPAYHVRQQWQANAGESLYGLGQQQIGTLDIRGYDLDLWQHNTRVVVPFLVSSSGYGILWDNMSYTRFGDPRQFEPIPAQNLLDAQGEAGGLTVNAIDGSTPGERTANLDIRGGGPGERAMKDTRWEGSVVAPATGDYQFKTYSNGEIKVWLDNKLIIHHFRQDWLADEEQVKVHLEANRRYPIKVEWSIQGANAMRLTWKTPSAEADKTSLWSEVADGIDYYFVYGPKLDDVVAGYRLLTGQATMMPEWAFGLWQSRQRYVDQQQSIDVVKEFRSRKIPFDNIVQDWQYWKPDGWGSHEFDPSRFPDPVGWLQQLHALHAHVMISVWGKFFTGTDNFEALNKAGYLFQPNLQEQLKDGSGHVFTFYDAFNPGARQMFWSQVNSNLFQKGIDAWWMDATEPEITRSPPIRERQQSHLPGRAREYNGYALYNSEAVYDGQRSAAPNQRVFILTRSGFAGQQRYATATWSGDITSTWTAMAKQIPAGLGFCISGIPYWTQDIGGYTMQTKFSTRNPKPEDEEEWRELNARWFEFGTFTPLLRVHGELKVREMWSLGGDSHPAYQAEVKFDRLRYRMLPYIYSQAGDVTQRSATIMRPLVMDFAADQTARELADEYMFGPAFLVAPVTTFLARDRGVYLPKAPGWYDFWTGKTVAPGTRIEAPAPYDAIPIYVKAGSIVPFGPDIQYIGEEPADPLTVYVYDGASGSFSLYEDEGTNYNYEKGAFARIPMTWDQATGTLSVGGRQGTFPGMLTERTIQAVLVSAAKPVAFSFEPAPIKSVRYTGEPVELKLK